MARIQGPRNRKSCCTYVGVRKRLSTTGRPLIPKKNSEPLDEDDRRFAKRSLRHPAMEGYEEA